MNPVKRGHVWANEEQSPNLASVDAAGIVITARGEEGKAEEAKWSLGF